MDLHIGKYGTRIASITHNDPEAIEAFVRDLRIHAQTTHIDWYYIVGYIAVIMAIGDLQHIQNAAKAIIPDNLPMILHLAA